MSNTKEGDFINQYVVNFMATVDANNVCIVTGKVIKPCSYTTALHAAQRAWLRYQERSK